MADRGLSSNTSDPDARLSSWRRYGYSVKWSTKYVQQVFYEGKKMLPEWVDVFARGVVPRDTPSIMDLLNPRVRVNRDISSSSSSSSSR